MSLVHFPAENTQPGSADDGSSWLDQCKERRAAASKTVMFFARRVKRFAAHDHRDDGTLRCFACGQIDEPEWHDDSLCFAVCSMPRTAAETVSVGTARSDVHPDTPATGGVQTDQPGEVR